MRRGSQDAELITSQIVDQPEGNKKSGGQIIGVNLGWSFCAEHEWGIDGIRRAFGIPGEPERRRGTRDLMQSDLVGAEVRTITKVPKSLIFREFESAVYLVYSSYYEVEEPSQEYLDRMMEIRSDSESDLQTAWSRGSFGIHLKKDQSDVLTTRTMVLGQLYEALRRKDAMIFIGGRSNPFGNGGLVIAIRSRVPADALRQMKESDENYLDLIDAVEKVEKETGLKAKLEAAGRKYFYLSPRWAKDVQLNGETTEHPVVFWLNPYEQRKNNSGYYTVEQLLDWIEGKGPIPKSEAEA